MAESTKDLLFSFIPLGGWYVSTTYEDPLYKFIGQCDLVLAVVLVITALCSRYNENKRAKDDKTEAV